MEVLEASPSKPSGSSVVLMVMIYTAGLLGYKCYHIQTNADKPPGSRLCFIKHTLFHAGCKWMERTNATVHFLEPPHGETAAEEAL